MNREILNFEDLDIKDDEINQSSESSNPSRPNTPNEPNSLNDSVEEKYLASDEQSQQSQTNEINELGNADDAGLLYSFLHLLDDIYVYGRTVIENNYFNLSDNVDFNLVYPNIYIGNYSTSTNLELLQGLGITHVLTVLPTFNPPFPEKFTYHHVPAYDDESQNLQPYLQQTNEFISCVLEQHGKLLIHCMVGRSRSVAVFMAFLINVIQGRFNQSFVDTTSDNDVSNEIEYNKFGVKQIRVIADGVAAVRYIPANNMQASLDSSDIARLEYLPPQLSNKYRSFMIYKKNCMIEEIEKIIENYNSSEFSGANARHAREDLYNTILAYVQKYRSIACPNEYFHNQLLKLL
jgi:hypothetical protein